MQPLRPLAKCGIVFAGFVVAVTAALIAVIVRQHLTAGPEAQASSGMYAFGDLLLAVAVCGVVGVAPLVLGLAWLRPVAWFWRGAVVVALAAAFTGPLMLALTWLVPPQSVWAMAAPLRVMAMPVLGALWFTSGTFAPEQRARWLLWGAATVELTGFVTTVIVKIILPLGR